MKKLILIPARGGSKGLPRKNIRLLAGKPMIYYTLDAATSVYEEGDEICVSTEDFEIIQKVNEYGLNVPFIRPEELSTDSASTENVIRHALDFYNSRGVFFDVVVLLQVTSPLRNSVDIKSALFNWDEKFDMIVSVKETDSNPYYVLYEEEPNGFLQKSKPAKYTRRQDCPVVYELNGAISIINCKSLQLCQSMMELRRVKKFVMEKLRSIDIDDEIDFFIAESLLKNS